MPAEQALLPRDIRVVLDWAEKWRAIPTRKQIARQLGVSEATVARIVRNGGYRPSKLKVDIDALALSIEPEKSVHVEQIQNVSHQGEIL